LPETEEEATEQATKAAEEAAPEPEPSAQELLEGEEAPTPEQVEQAKQGDQYVTHREAVQLIGDSVPNMVGAAIGASIAPVVNVVRDLHDRMHAIETGEMGSVQGAAETVHYHLPGKPEPIVMEGEVHELAARVARRLLLLGNCYLVGPTQCGKTELAKQLAQILGCDRYAMHSFSGGSSEAHLTGRMLFDGAYVSTETIKVYECGGLLVWDEIDAIDANVAVVTNSGLSNGRMSVPNRKDNPVAIRHPDCYIVAIGNTLGEGSWEYAGRNQQDCAFMQRFDSGKFRLDYDRKLEAKLLPVRAMQDALWRMRSNIVEHDVQGHCKVTTKTFANAQLLLAGGLSQEQTIGAVVECCSDEDRDRIMSGVTINPTYDG
jgi:hypothetical protein